MREALSLPRLLAALLALSLGMVSGCANTKGQTEARTPGNFIDDEAIETLVVRQIRKSDEGLKNAHLSAVSYNGILLLLGQVDNDRRIFEKTRGLLNLVSNRTINGLHIPSLKLERHEGVHATFEFYLIIP